MGSECREKKIGTYSDEQTAARMRDLYIKTHFPESHYKMNFEWTVDEIIQWKPDPQHVPLSEETSTVSNAGDTAVRALLTLSH